MLYTKTKQRANNRITNLKNIVRWRKYERRIEESKLGNIC